jgi:hypothetical protein
MVFLTWERGFFSSFLEIRYAGRRYSPSTVKIAAGYGRKRKAKKHSAFLFRKSLQQTQGANAPEHPLSAVPPNHKPCERVMPVRPWWSRKKCFCCEDYREHRDSYPEASTPTTSSGGNGALDEIIINIAWIIPYD